MAYLQLGGRFWSICFVKHCFYTLNKGLSGIRSEGRSLLASGFLPYPCSGRCSSVSSPDTYFLWRCCGASRRDLGAPLSPSWALHACALGPGQCCVQATEAELQLAGQGRDPAPHVLPKMTQLLASPP